MNTTSFFRQYQITENPFQAEEARHDAVFSRVEHLCHHPDYAKVRGDFTEPAAAIVFGERGAGKTAIRLQIEDDLRQHNQAHPDQRCLPILYDELNPILDRFQQSVRIKDADEALAALRLTDHLDGILATIVPRIVDQALNDSRSQPTLLTDGSLTKALRQTPPSVRRDLLLLQICYDRPDEGDLRTPRFRRAVQAGRSSLLPLMKWSFLILLVAALVLTITFFIANPESQRWLWIGAILVLALTAAVLGGRWAWQLLRQQRLARDLAGALRVQHRSTLSFAKSLRAVRLDDILTGDLPRDQHDDPRYGMMQRLLRVIRPLGYRSIVVLLDRVDEPTIVNGEPARMRAVVWPMFNNKFLQQDHIGIKMLLPLDLKHLLFRESQEFFREARLDKQNLVERMTWSGAMLYDVCTARLNACRDDNAEPMSLRDLFDDSVTHQDVVDALDQMQQPRDAFKLMYRVVQEHCANVPEETPQWKIPKLVLDTVRREQVDRLAGMLRGVRPA